MNLLETEKLATALEKLIEQYDVVRHENMQLQKAHNQLLAERDGLMRKNEVARHKIETMLEKLHALEVQS